MSTTRQRHLPSRRPSKRVALALTAALTFAIVGSETARPEPPDPSAETLVVRRGLIEYEFRTELGSPAYSALQDCLVKAGDRVKAGQVLGRLQDGEARAEVALREAEAASDIEVRVSEARSALAAAKLQRTASLIRRNASSQEEYAQHKQEAATAALEVEQSKHKRKIAGFQLQQAKATLGTRALVSPHDGVVTAVLRRKGESVAPHDPIFQVVDTSEIRVVGQVDVTEAWRLQVGQPVRVIAEVAGAELEVEQKVFPGVISFIDAQIDPMTRTCKIFVRAPNPGGELKAGLEARVEIDPTPDPQPEAAPADTPRRVPTAPKASTARPQQKERL